MLRHLPQGVLVPAGIHIHGVLYNGQHERRLLDPLPVTIRHTTFSHRLGAGAVVREACPEHTRCSAHLLPQSDTPPQACTRSARPPRHAVLCMTRPLLCTATLQALLLWLCMQAGARGQGLSVTQDMWR